MPLDLKAIEAKTPYSRENPLPFLQKVADHLARQEGMQSPRIEFIENMSLEQDTSPNADGEISIRFNRLMREQTSKEHLVGITGHELWHVKERQEDGAILYFLKYRAMAVTDVLLGTIALIHKLYGAFSKKPVNLLYIMPALPLILAGLYFNRRSEYKADEFSARVTGHPEWLSQWLSKQPDDGINWIPTHPSSKNRMKNLQEKFPEAASQ